MKKIFLFSLLYSLAVFAAPKNDFDNVLNLTKYSVCKDAVEHTQQSNMTSPALTGTHQHSPAFALKGGIIIHQSKLKALSSSPFPWRFEITNGYQEGFVYYALLGYASEQSGDIPFAYRCYQNSLACIDEDESFDYPLPRAEIYLAIGRTCLAANRYMDAKDWLDTAFFEAGNNKNLQAAIDRVLIQRANELGDYQEVLFLYQHLLSIANDNKVPLLDKEGCPQGGVVNSPLSKVEHPGFTSGVGKGDLNSPPVLGDTSRVLPRGGVAHSDGVVERTTNHPGMRGAHGLRTTDYANYSQILFYSRKDREGFSKLLKGISKFGIDNDLGFKDPLFDKFFHNILRANDDEVSQFYDSLQYALADARALKGDEDFIIQLLEARQMMCRAYDFLQPEEDLVVIKQRINQVKKTLAETKQPIQPVKRNLQRKKLKISKASKSKKVSRYSNVRSSPEIISEAALMNVELLYMTGKTNETVTECLELLKKTKNKKIRQQLYDGTTWENAIRMLAVSAYLDLEGTTQWSKISFDNSLRAETLRAKLMSNGLMRYDTDEGLPKLPYYNPALISVLEYRAKDICEKEDDATAIIALENALRNRTFLFDLYPLLVSRYVRTGNIEAGYKAIFNRRSEDLYDGISTAHFCIYWKIIADVTDEQFKQLNTLWKTRNLLRHCGRNSTWRYNHGTFMTEEKIRFGSQEERKFKPSSALCIWPHPRYFERCMTYLSEEPYTATNGFLCNFLQYLPSMVKDYPSERMIPLINYARKLFKVCKMKHLRGELAVLYQCKQRAMILPPPLMVLPIDQVDKTPEFLDKLEEYLNKRDSK